MRVALFRSDDRLNLGVCLCGRVAQDGEILAPPVVLEGGTTNERATSLLLRFQDGERQLTMLAADSDELDTREVNGITTRGQFPPPDPR